MASGISIPSSDAWFLAAVAVHVSAGMVAVVLTAFYVDNGPRLPIWRRLPPPALWILPAAVGVPVVGVALNRHRDRRR